MQSELNKCDICGKITTVQRKCYYYDVHCSCCHGGKHFQIVWHCKDCKPHKPKRLQYKV